MCFSRLFWILNNTGGIKELNKFETAFKLTTLQSAVGSKLSINSYRCGGTYKVESTIPFWNLTHWSLSFQEINETG